MTSKTAAIPDPMPSFFSEPEKALELYNRLGYYIETGIWTPAEIDDLTRASEQLPTFQDKTYAPAMHPHRINPAFLKALKNPRIVHVMEFLLGGKVSGIQTEFFFSKPSVHGFARHQDNHYVEAKSEVFGSAWTALQDVSPHNGGLIVWPGTHKLPILPTEPIPTPVGTGQDPNAHKQQAMVPAGYEAVDVTIKKGAVVFIHGHIVHASHRNQSENFRRALLMTYVRQGEHFRPGNTAKRAAVDVYAMGPQTPSPAL